MEYIVDDPEVRTDHYSDDVSRSKATISEEDMTLNPNEDGKMAAERLGLQPSKKEIQRESIETLPGIETIGDPYFKFKLLVEELLIIFAKREERCGICIENIVKLCKHIAETHEDYQNSTPIKFRCDICGKLYLNLIGLIRHRDSHYHSESSHSQSITIQLSPSFNMYRDPVEIVCDVETPDLYFKVKLLVEELLIIFTKCEEKCGICVEYIVKLCQHMGETHEDDQNPILLCDICGNVYSSTLELTRHRDSHFNSESSDTMETQSSTSLNISSEDVCLNNRPPQNITPTNVNPDLRRSAKFPCESNKFVVNENVADETNETVDPECQVVFSTLQHTEQNKRSRKSSSYLNYCKRRPFECAVCGKGFVRSINLKMHEINHTRLTGRKPYKCSVCGKLFSRKYNLNTHKIIHTGENPFNCDECGKNFSTKANLKNHKISHTGEKPFKCDECGKSYTSKANLNYHRLTHTGEKPFNCNECGKSFSRKDNFNIHKLIHTGEKRFKCDVCGRCFLLLCYLRAHKKRNNCKSGRTVNKNRQVKRGIKPFKCDLCGKNFTETYNLKVHKLIHTRDVSHKIHECLTCGKMFWNTRHLNRHKLMHTGEKRFQCGLCGRGFIFKSTLGVHILSHTREKQFKCELCGKGFLLKSILARHLLTHTGVKHFKCDECEKCFRALWDLRAHTKRNNCKRKTPGEKRKVAMKSNKSPTYEKIFQNAKIRDLHAQKSNRNGEWPFKCGLCGKGFFYNCHLMKHRVKHASPGEEPFKCDVCGKGFYYNSHLNAHRSLHTGESPFNCDECGKSYPSSRQLKFHKRHHKGNKTSVESVAGVRAIQSSQSDE